jgi:hypothetical protein
MLTGLIVVLLVASLGCNWLQARAARKHVTALTAMHNDMAAAARDVKKVIAHFEPGTERK